ncbi:Dam family site-specific DNA-(adenine-N6)-methyltransferase [Aestuariibacter salexigens]|uniref:Dam family site-specific DNA-(adenine-N6)-methyltransferase n=1 Tax=Aestuariibacter salexigens TaxID=226010 RepID=UPI0003FB567A|nr:Dam family site-specific DNA-(adenine-N6)-methyltransferase [Aestuariibacter salexigens]
MKSNNKKKRAFLKWAGGKYSLVSEINEQLPSANKLIEPFVGAGSVFLNTSYKQYLLNDINPDLINLYNTLKHNTEQFISDAQQLFCAANNQRERYEALRKEFNQSQDSYSRSVLFLYLNRHGYNGLCRYNASGYFNVPFGRYRAPYFPRDELYFFAEKAQRAEFTCLPFQKVFSKARQNAVIYCDPPYAPISDTAHFTHYAKGGFSAQDQIELARLAMRAGHKRNIPVLISNHDTPFTREIYRHARLTELQVRRSISQKGEKRVKVGELLALYRC